MRIMRLGGFSLICHRHHYGDHVDHHHHQYDDHHLSQVLLLPLAPRVTRLLWRRGAGLGEEGGHRIIWNCKVWSKLLNHRKIRKYIKKLHSLEQIDKSEWKLRSSDCFGGGLRTPPGRSRRCFFLILQKKKYLENGTLENSFLLTINLTTKNLQNDTCYTFIYLSFRISCSMSLFQRCKKLQMLQIYLCYFFFSWC